MNFIILLRGLNYQINFFDVITNLRSHLKSKWKNFELIFKVKKILNNLKLLLFLYL